MILIKIIRGFISARHTYRVEKNVIRFVLCPERVVIQSAVDHHRFGITPGRQEYGQGYMQFAVTLKN